VEMDEMDELDELSSTPSALIIDFNERVFYRFCSKMHFSKSIVVDWSKK